MPSEIARVVHTSTPSANVIIKPSAFDEKIDGQNDVRILVSNNNVNNNNNDNSNDNNKNEKERRKERKEITSAY